MVTDPYCVAEDLGLRRAAAALDQAEMASRLKDALAMIGIKAPTLRAIRVLRHKPGRRFVVAYELQCGGETVGVIGKHRAGRNPKFAFRRLQAFRVAGFDEACADGIIVPLPLAVWPDLGLWLQREAPGVSATQLLAASCGPRLGARIAEAAHKVHRALVPATRSHGMGDEVRILREKLPEAARALPHLTRRIERLIKICERLADAVSTPRECGIHRDFYADQVIVGSNGLAVIDFDLYCIGDPGLDIGNFLGHVIEQGLREASDAEAFAGVVAATRERFGSLSGRRNLHAADVYTDLTLARHVYLSTVIPGRVDSIEALLELCEARIGGRIYGSRSDRAKMLLC